jgi:hypothetical protein
MTLTTILNQLKPYRLFAFLFLLTVLEMGLFTLWRHRFDPYKLPFYFLAVQMSIGLLALFFYPKDGNDRVEVEKKGGRISFCAGVLWHSILALAGIFVAFWLLKSLYVQVPVSLKYSDIIPQAQKLTQRFSQFEYPYAVFHDFGYPVSPTYLPAEWMPYLLAEFLKLDPRYISFAAFAFAYGVLAYQLIREKHAFWARVVLLGLPILFILLTRSRDASIWTVSLELLILAYYLLLGLSLQTRSGLWQVGAILLCLMSRYSLVLWLPLYAYMLWTREGWKTSMRFCLLILGGCLLLYGPFWLQDPLIFSHAQAHLDQATLVAWTHTEHIKNGLGFALYFAERAGDGVANLLSLQQTQWGLTALTSLLLGLIWRQRKDRLDFRLFAIGSLKISLAIYYAFIQMPYAYLFITPLVLSWVILYTVFASPLHAKGVLGTRSPIGQYAHINPFFPAVFTERYNLAAIVLTLVACLFFIAQMDTALFGRWHHTVKINSILLFCLNMLAALFAYRLFSQRGYRLDMQPTAISKSLAWGLLSVFCLWTMQDLLTKIFANQMAMNKYTDIFFQLNAQAQRLLEGKNPYADLWVENAYNAYPAYMPAHFMPVALALKMGWDARWLGVWLLSAASFVYGFWLSRLRSPSPVKWIGILSPSVMVWYFIMAFQESTIFELAIPYTAETFIVAYYLVLFVGLLWDNFFLIALGICLCLLSRYTLVFWLPVFVIIYFKTKPLRQNLWLWAIVVGSVLAFYVFPFWLRDTSIFSKGMIHYREAILSEWIGVEGISYSFETGIYFAAFFKDGIIGDMGQRIQTMRWVQLGVLALTLAILLRVWWRRRQQIRQPMVYAALALQIVLIVFYAFSPLTYRYYLMTTLTLAGVLCFLTAHWAFEKTPQKVIS